MDHLKPLNKIYNKIVNFYIYFIQNKIMFLFKNNKELYENEVVYKGI